MAKSLHLTRLISSSARIATTSNFFFFFSIKPKNIHKPYFSSRFLSTTSTPHPLQYDLIINHPTESSLSQTRRRPTRAIKPESSSDPSEPDFDSWVDEKLASERDKGRPGSGDPEMDKAKRKYYSKRRKRLYGSDSEDENQKSEDGFVELKPEIVEFDRLHEREEELYFYDTFAYPWEKDKHYKMVYELEKKYFPDQGLDKAFLEVGDESGKVRGRRKVVYGGKKKEVKGVGVESGEKLVFFDEVKEEKEKVGEVVTEKKVGHFFKGVAKSPDERGGGEPFLVTRNGELPPRWDGPNGTVVLVDKPKGWTSFTVCGKLRRVVKVQKVGHAGTLDPMATGLLIVCIGKATKVVDRYQGMIKGYSGVLRLGEATSTLDADSPVIQREPWEHIKDGDIKKALTSFRGEIMQVPPMFSAIKVGGERMYEKARRGETVELSPRRISIFEFDIERSLDDRFYPFPLQCISNLNTVFLIKSCVLKGAPRRGLGARRGYQSGYGPWQAEARLCDKGDRLSTPLHEARLEPFCASAKKGACASASKGHPRPSPRLKAHNQHCLASVRLAPFKTQIKSQCLTIDISFLFCRQNLVFRVVCSKGTYIRSLCADLAKALGSCAHLTALRRDSIGEYSVKDAWEFDELEAAITKNYF